jgi:hypothetical protein
MLFSMRCKACHDIYREQTLPAEGELKTIICHVCKISFRQSNHRSSRAYFCSSQCYAIFRHEEDYLKFKGLIDFNSDE